MIYLPVIPRDLPNPFCCFGLEGSYRLLLLQQCLWTSPSLFPRSFRLGAKLIPNKVI
jgi:hypothetical protein